MSAAVIAREIGLELCRIELASVVSKYIDEADALLGSRSEVHYVVEFPRPDAPLRERLWRTVLPSEAPRADDLDFGFLARQFDLAGGDIKTVALDADFKHYHHLLTDGTNGASGR
jgi:hypothetical protein